MRRRQILAVLPFAFAAGTVAASEPPPAGGSGQFVDLAPVALPIVADGRLVNYVFAQIRINLSGSADAINIRAKEPWFRDALIRAAHRTPFTQAGDYTRVDEARLKAALMRDAVAIAGARNIVSVTVTSQTPKQRTRLPTPSQRPR